MQLRVATAQTSHRPSPLDPVPSLPLTLGFLVGFLGLLFGLGFRLSRELYQR